MRTSACCEVLGTLSRCLVNWLLEHRVIAHNDRRAVIHVADTVRGRCHSQFTLLFHATTSRGAVALALTITLGTRLMRQTNSTLSILLVALPLLVVTGYSQIGWRNDHAAFEKVATKLRSVNLERTFPSDGDDLSASVLHVVRGADTIPLESLVRGRSAVIYFSRQDCAPCKWLGAQLDSMSPRWRDSILVVGTYTRARDSIPPLMLDSASTAMLSGVPSTLLVDARGFVRHSALGLQRVVKVFNFEGVPAPDADRLKSYKDSVKASATAANVSTTSNTTNANK